MQPNNNKTDHRSSAAPGLAVTVLRRGHTTLSRGYGDEVSSETLFRAGSVTKSLVALIVLQLIAEDRVQSDDPVVTHLPAFRTRNKTLSDAITIEHLITHRSGLTTLDGNRDAPTTGDQTGPATVTEALSDAQLDAPPGAAFQYSNANYAVLTDLIETLEARPFEAAAQTRIFAPLGMHRSYIGAPPSGIPAAVPYRLWFGQPVSWHPPSAVRTDRRWLGAGGWWTSSEDLARFLEALRSRDSRVVPADSERLFTPLEFAPGHGYAYGWFTDSTRETGPILQHSGFTPGFLSLATIVPDSETVVVVLTNMSGFAHGNLPAAATHTVLGWEAVEATALLGARIAIWSALAAPLGLLLLLFKTAGQLRDPARETKRALNIIASILLLAGAVALWFTYPRLVDAGFGTAWRHFPDLTLVTVAAMALAVLLASARLALVFVMPSAPSPQG
ncbi:MAG: serine hydrolase domain-containing protein [Pseudomonadota bacterium]